MIKFSGNGFELKSILASQVDTERHCVFPAHQGWGIVLPEFVKPLSSFLKDALCLGDKNSLLCFLPFASLRLLAGESGRREINLLRKNGNILKDGGVEPEFLILTDEYKAENALKRLRELKWDVPVLCFEMTRPRFLRGEFKDERLNHRLRNCDFNAYADRRELSFPVPNLNCGFEQRELMERFCQGLFRAAQTGGSVFDLSEICEAGLAYWPALDNGERHRLVNQVATLLERVHAEFPAWGKFILFSAGGRSVSLKSAPFNGEETKKAFLKLMKKTLESLQRGAAELKLEFVAQPSPTVIS